MLESFPIPSLPCLLVLTLALTIIYFIFSSLTHPLRSLPAPHWSCHISPIWILHKRWSHRENRTLKEAHDKYGEIVRLAPNEISVNCVKGGIREVYAGGMEKDEWYVFFGNFGG